jgi:hypothetical protein
MQLFPKRKKPRQEPQPIPLYTQGDDVLVNGQVQHFVSTTAGTDSRQQDNVVTGRIATMNAEQIKQAIAEFHKKHS